MNDLYSLGTFEATPEIIGAVTAVLKSGRLSYGEVSREFEQRFARLHGSSYGILSNSGTSSLVVAIQALKEINNWKNGDEVICPALTFVATVNAILMAGLKPVLVDIDPLHYDITPSVAEHAIGPRTRAIMAVNLFGQACDLLALRKLCDRYNLKLIEDSCEAILKDGIGRYSDVAIFSFYMAHILTSGVGGIAICNSELLALTMRSLVNHGIAMQNLPTGEFYDPTFLARHFNFARIGHSFRITEIEAAIALSQLRDIDVVVAKREILARFLIDRLKDLSDHFQFPQTRTDMRGSWMVFPIVSRFEPKEAIMEYLRHNKVECRDMVPLTNQPCYSHLFHEDDYPNAKFINRHGFYIGCHQGILAKDATRLVEVFHEYVKERIA